ncbi:MFS transporter [Herbaspirillum sp. WKF16]|jgi:DHA2 family multidrug resistance protein-like MFS transporter|uniref:MFS transporter n=1 Tax=Herbaspirillum sp. WKF16 TaxID=3028312 RepID=UPI00406D43C7
MPGKQTVQVQTHNGAPEDADGLPREQRILAIVTVVLAVAIAVMDGSIANLALPSIAADLRATDADAIWIINSYQIAMAVCLLPLASLGEVIGYRRVYLCGLVLFTLSSLACAVSADMLQLSLARVAQGVGAAGILSVNTALIRFIYPSRLLGRAIGYNALVAGTSTALGPTVAGFILHFASWHWLFLINIPLGLLSLLIGWKALPFNPLSDRKYDLRSALVCMLFIGLLLYTVDAIGHVQGWGVVLGCALLTLASLAVLLKVQSATAPMLPLDLLRIPLFALSIGTSFCSFAAQMATFVMLPFMLQNHLGMSAARAGLLLTAWPIAVALTGVVAGKLSDRMSSGLLGGIGLAIMCAGLLSLLAIGAATPDGVIALQFAVCGFGFGLFQSPNNRTLISSAPRSRTGGASGMLGTGRLTGQTAGASVVAMMLTLYASPYALVLWCAAALAGAGCVVSLSRLRHHGAQG